MLRPDKQRDRTTAFMTVINENDDRLAQVALRGHENIQPQKDLLAEYFKDAGWESERVIRKMQATDDFYYDMIAQVKMERADMKPRYSYLPTTISWQYVVVPRDP